MNLWKCEHPGCENTCVGNGGAIGLRAIGWLFVPSKHVYDPLILFCPVHLPANEKKSCEVETDIFQSMIKKTLRL